MQTAYSSHRHEITGMYFGIIFYPQMSRRHLTANRQSNTHCTVLYWEHTRCRHCKYFTFLLQFLIWLITAYRHHIIRGEWKVMPPTLLLTNRWQQYWYTTGWSMFCNICSFTSVGTQHVSDSWHSKGYHPIVIRVKQCNKGYLTFRNLASYIQDGRKITL